MSDAAGATGETGLVEAARQGDLVAWEQVVRRYQEPLFRAAYLMTRLTPVAEQMLTMLKEMDPGAFEVLIQRLLERLGYEDAEVRGGTGDGGVDVYAVLRLHGMTAVQTIVQAKRWTSGNVSGRVIRELRGALRVDEHGVVITTANFTPEAVAEATAQGKAPVGMVDGPSLVQLLIENGIGVSTVSVPLRRLDPESLLVGDE